MAHAYIKLGKISDKKIEDYVDDILFDEVGKTLGIEPLKRFCARLYIDPTSYKDETNQVKVLTTVRDFLTKRLNTRKIALQHIGFGLMLEHLYMHGKFYLAKFNELDSDIRQDLIKFIMSDQFDLYTTLLDSTPSGFKPFFKSLASSIPTLGVHIQPKEINPDEVHQSSSSSSGLVADKSPDATQKSSAESEEAKIKKVKTAYAAALNSMHSLEKFMTSHSNTEFAQVIKDVANIQTRIKNLDDAKKEPYLINLASLADKCSDTMCNLRLHVGTFKSSLHQFTDAIQELNVYRVMLKDQIFTISNELLSDKKITSTEESSLKSIMTLLKYPSITNLSALRFFESWDADSLHSTIEKIKIETNKSRDVRLKEAVLNYIDLTLKINAMNLDLPSIKTLIDIGNPKHAVNPKRNPLIGASMAIENLPELPMLKKGSTSSSPKK